MKKITNYKVVTGPVTSGSKFLLVQKHFALVQDPPPPLTPGNNIGKMFV